MRFHDSHPNVGRSMPARPSERQSSATTDNLFRANQLTAKVNQANLWLRPVTTIIDREQGWRGQLAGETNVSLHDIPLSDIGSRRSDLSELFLDMHTERARSLEKLKKRALAVALGATVASLLAWSAQRVETQAESPAENHADIGLISPEDDSGATDLNPIP